MMSDTDRRLKILGRIESLRTQIEEQTDPEWPDSPALDPLFDEIAKLEGALEAPRGPCPYCDGEGIVNTPRERQASQGGSVRCVECGGTGKS
jgi:hypothetical protein